MRIKYIRFFYPCILNKIILLFFLFNTISSIGHAQFREKYRGTDTTDHIKGMYFLTPSTGFVAFSNFLGFTQDSGKTFIQRNATYANTDFNGYSANLLFGFTFNGVFAFSTDSLFAYGHFGFEPSILFSKDQGVTWKLVFHLPINIYATTLSNGFTDLKIINNVGLAVYNEGVYRTTNRGQSWTFVLNTPNQPLKKLSFPSANTAYVCGGTIIFKSSNGGINWTDISFSPNAGYENFNNIFFNNSNTGYLTEASQSRIYRTTDGGANWKQMNDETVIPIYANDLYFTNDSTGFAAAGLYDVVKTTDYGKTWELCKKNTSYQFLYYGMNALFFISPKTMWAGGDGEYLMISTDADKPTLPKAYFKIDTTNLNVTGKVNLVNYSKTNYQYKWFKNDTLISNAYNASYTHNIFKLSDTLKLVVSNGVDSDTSIQTTYFYPPLILSSFTPNSGTNGTTITITGTNLDNVGFVSFGGVPASNFTIISSTKITAVLGNGASGQIIVGARNGIGKLNGFNYVSVPNIDLPLTIPDTLLCKSESAIIQIQNTESDVTYDLQDSLGQNYGSANGTGGLLVFKSLSISTSGNYYLWATRNITVRRKFSNPIYFTVEHPRGVFSASKLNIVQGESVNYYNYSTEAQHFEWKLGQDASTKNSMLPSLQNISYASTGQKTLTLISSTNAGCADTSLFNAVYVYHQPNPPDVCYSQNIDDSDTYDLAGKLNNLSPDINDGFLICGSGNNPLIKSRYGNSKQISGTGISYIAKYTTNGSLQWVDYTNQGNINASVTDADGNIYITGSIISSSFFHFNNGDSMQFAVDQTEKNPSWSKINGFVLKVDSTGKYIWHTILYDPSPLFKGYPVQGGIGTSIKIHNDQIVITGNFLARLSYYYKDSLSTLISLSTYNHDANDNLNNFIISINKNGALQWKSYTLNNATNQRYRLTVAGFDKEGNSYFSGYYENQLTVYDAKDSTTNFNGFINAYWGSVHGFILKFDSNGNLLWNVHLDNNFDFHESYFNSIVIDSTGNSYVAGFTSQHNSPQYFILYNADGSKVNVKEGPYFISKFNKDGNVEWIKGSNLINGTGICLKDNNLYTTGNWKGEQLMDKGDLFMAKYDIQGNLKRISVSKQSDLGHISSGPLFLDSHNNIVMAGSTDNYEGSSIRTIFGSTIHPDGTDVFYAKLNPGFCSNDSIIVADAGVNASLCAGDSVDIGNEALGGIVSWTSNPIGFVSDSLHIRVAPTEATTYYLTVTSPSGEIAQDSVVVEISTVDADAGYDKTICKGTNQNIGSYPAIPGNTYSWISSPSGFTSNDSDPYVSPDSTTLYFLTVADQYGCKGMDTVLINTVSVNINAGADTSICAGNAVQLGKNDSTYSYSWKSEPQGFVSTDANPIVSPTVSTIYFLSATSNENCNALDTIQVNVNPLPGKPFIYEDTLHHLISSIISGNQWYIDTTQIIPGATSKMYKPAASGMYAVQVEDNGCKSVFSDIYNYSYPDTTINPVNDNSIKLSPNPAQNFIIVTFDIPNTSQITLEIYDINGNLISPKKIIMNNQRIDISQLAKGMYLMKFTNESGKALKTMSFIKM